MRKILFDHPVPEEAYLVMQREAAEKFSGWGRETQFSVLAKARFEIQISRWLRRSDFHPKPNVDSVFLAIMKRPIPLVRPDDYGLFRDFVCFGFQGWRKNLKTGFKAVFTYKQWKRLSKSLDFSIDAKPSGLTIFQWVGLFDFFNKHLSKPKKRIINVNYPG